MKKYALLSIGGFLGAIARYSFKSIQILGYHETIPLNTLLINVSGSFILALIITIAFEVWEFDSDIRLGICTGFVGAFTTFSTMCKETVALFSAGDYYSAISYITVSTMMGLGAVFLGIVLAREIGLKLAKRKNEDKNILTNESDVE